MQYSPQIYFKASVPATHLYDEFKIADTSHRCNDLTLYINIYLHFMSFLHINKAQVVEIPP